MYPRTAAERRTLERFAIVVSAYVSTHEPQERSPARTRDISANGAFICLEPAPDVGTRVRVEMELVIESLPELLNIPEYVQIRVVGRVIRQNRAGVGVIFDAQLKIEQPATSGKVKIHERDIHPEQRSDVRN